MISEIEKDVPRKLLEMPDDPMREIMERCGFESIETLRRTCHTLRNFIDDKHIDPKFSALYFIFAEDKITLTLYSEASEDATELTYKEAGNYTKITYENNQKSHEKLVEDVNFIDLFCQDFKLLAKHSRTIPSVSFSFLIEWFPEVLPKELLKTLKAQNFRAEKLHFNVNNSNQIFSILQFFDSNFLKTLCISDTKKPNRILDLEEIVKLDQWKKLEKVEIQCSTVRKPERFKHLKEGTANFMTITRGDLEILKESFLHSPNFSCMVLKYRRMEDPPQIFEFLGEFGQSRRRWFYRIPNSQDDVLSVEISSKEVIFKNHKWDEVPINAVVEK